MKVLNAPRNSGKTTWAVKESAATGAVIICSDMNHKGHIEGLAHVLDLKIPEPLTFVEFRQAGNAPGTAMTDVGVIIDELEMFLSSLIYGLARIKAVTMTATEGVEVHGYMPQRTDEEEKELKSRIAKKLKER